MGLVFIDLTMAYDIFFFKNKKGQLISLTVKNEFSKKVQSLSFLTKQAPINPSIIFRCEKPKPLKTINNTNKNKQAFLSHVLTVT